MEKFIKFAIKAGKVLAGVAAVYTAAGAYDVLRNKPADKAVVKRYFTGNGILTWVLSPLNTLLDLLSLPYVNKGVWKLED
ncbi:MAG: hypothetical protein JWQ02_2724, partial [Capsulimonas sp.]|nr:hypothetical protein [Capsulimonas sp.]